MQADLVIRTVGLLLRSVTIHLPHDTIRIVILTSDTICIMILLIRKKEDIII